MKFSNIYFSWHWFILRLLAVFFLLPVFVLSGLVFGTKDFLEDRRSASGQRIFWHLFRGLRVQMITVLLFVLGGFRGIPKNFSTHTFYTNP